MQEEETGKEKSEAALREERILEFWRKNKTFEKSLEKSAPKGEFIFYEGPPTANGQPGVHHLEARAFKDAIPRYKTMRGYHVRRKGGWDTHGLAVEIQTEKKLGLNSKKAIEEYGIAKFNQKCKESVWEYLDVWNKFTKRIGYWIDQENPYVTYYNDYIESVWSVVKKINEQKLLYKDYKVVPWCPRCGTVLSSHELAQGYENVKDLSVTAKFKIVGFPNGYFLAWTTTPWTLPGNVALAVGADVNYVEIKVGEEIFVLAKERLSIITEPYEVVAEHKGKNMVGMEYEPLFPYLKEQLKQKREPTDKMFKVYSADFVNINDGTGIVHTAVMYGQDDFELGTKIGLPKHHLVGLDGKFLPGTGIFEGRFVKDEGVAVDIIKDLAGRGLLLKKEKYEHSYPHCWRCHTALIYYARDSWYIKMSDPKIKRELISQNQEINWEPAHIRDGRFGEWLREIKDWAVSRERYWGTPLPVWVCEVCKKIEVIGSISDLKAKTKKSGNKYFVMRHGESRSNINWEISLSANNHDELTPEGKSKVQVTANEFKDKDIHMLVVSPLLRTRQTAEIIEKVLDIAKENIIIDDRLSELGVHSFDGKTWKEYHEVFPKTKEYFNAKQGGDESFHDTQIRIMNTIYDYENRFKNKNILFITHGGPTWLLSAAVQGLSLGEMYRMINKVNNNRYDDLKNAEWRELDFVPLPHNADYELDLHKPYIDEVSLVCDCGGSLVRTKEVMDVWFDSGAMPFAQDHYPFENKNLINGSGYPADFISEAIDQTRGWFYTLHAVGVLMGRGKAYKNVICLGHLLDAKGKKMSKSIGNIVDPWEMIDKYGVDTLRLWMYSVNQPGESKNFDEKTIGLLHQQVFGLLYNVLAFYELYRDKTLEKNNRPKSENILDKWILAQLNELIDECTQRLDDYKLLEPVRGIRDFINDLSTWYLRRSRERIKEGDKEAKATLYFVLKTLAKLLAPFAPFTAEDIWLKLRNVDDVESVHLESWPVKPFKLFSFGKSKIIDDMQTVRNIVTLGLEARQKAELKVRQPLNKLRIKNYKLEIEYTELIKDEINVKEVKEDKNIENEVLLDTKITEELKQEGDYRELARALQDMRKKTGLTPSDVVMLTFDTNETGKNLIQKFENDMKKTVLVSNIEFKQNDGEEIKIDDLVFRVKIAIS